MNKIFTYLSKTPLLLFVLVVSVTSCHEANEFEEMKADVEKVKALDNLPASDFQISNESLGLDHAPIIHPGEQPTEMTTTHTRLPFIPSRRRRRSRRGRTCIGC